MGIKMKRDVFIKANHSLGLRKNYFSNEYGHFAQTISDSVSIFFLSCYHHSSSFLRTCYPFNFPPKNFLWCCFWFLFTTFSVKRMCPKDFIHPFNVRLMYKKWGICHCLLQSMSFYILVFKTSQRDGHDEWIIHGCQQLSFYEQRTVLWKVWDERVQKERVRCRFLFHVLQVVITFYSLFLSWLSIDIHVARLFKFITCLIVIF